MSHPAPHAAPPEELFGVLGSSPQGLSQLEAEERIARFGPNRLPPPHRRSPLQRFLLQFHNLLIYLLLAAGAIAGLLGELVDMAVILGVVVINAIIGFVQEGKAERALEAVSRLLTPNCTVLRDGEPRTLPTEALVPGDVVLLQSGDRVPADLRLFQGRGLHIDEALLTGESVPVEKGTGAAAPDAPVAERLGMAFSGTLVTHGQGRGLVVATGTATELGRISSMLAEVKPLTTPLLRQLDGLARWLTWVIVTLTVAIFAFGTLVRDIPWREGFMAAVGLAVAAIPEGLPAIVTIVLAIGVQRMARRHAVVRRLPAVETLGSVTVICSDKTGTLTRNEMTVTTVELPEGRLRVAGVGYEPLGAITAAEGPLPEEALMQLARAGALCNDARLVRGPEGWRVEGDPTEGALLTLATKAGLDLEEERRDRPRSDAIPFESEHRFMATLHHDHAGHVTVYVKGAPERLLAMCDRLADGAPLERDTWQRRAEALAREGQRVLALARAPLPAGHLELDFADLEEGVALLGLVGIIDPPREEAVAAVAKCRSAGVRVKMITGDHGATALAIAGQLGIGDGGPVLTGPELEALDEAGLRREAPQVDVFARASPEHKLRLVTAFQAEGEVLAMTGDGVNDAPALKRADIGVAMGDKGTDAAREAAEMVLTDDNFASIVHAIEEGRTVHDNLTKAILFLLPTNGGQAGVILVAILLGFALPITPVQILWVNMVTAVTLALAIAFEPPEAGVMNRGPRDPAAPLVSRFMLWRVGYVLALLVAGSVGMFLWEVGRGESLEAARVVTVNTLVAAQAFYLISARFITAPSLSLAALTGNPWVPVTIALILLLQLLFTYAPFMQALFGTAPIDGAAWLRIGLVGLAVFVAIEGEKWVVRWVRGQEAIK